MDTRTLASLRRSRLLLPLALALAGPLACGDARRTEDPQVHRAEPHPAARPAESYRGPQGVADQRFDAPVPHNSERYRKIDESGFRVTHDDPLSTFGIDVDTASYANVRRFLNAGTLPPADAVRIEELLNYFAYAPIAAQPGHPLGVASEIGPCPWAPGHLLARVRVAAPQADLTQQISKNLVFLLDVSGSMNDSAKLPLLKTAMIELAMRIGEEDSVGIVVYAGSSGVVLEPTNDREDIVAALDKLAAGGSTNGGAGIHAAYDLARKHFIKGGVNRVVLATDGDFNVGTTSDGDLVRLIEEQRRSGVFLTVLGFGGGNYNDSMLEQLADRGNGNYFYIDSLAEARKVLVDEAAANLVTIARDVKIQVEMNPNAVAEYRLLGYENRLMAAQDFANDAVDGGEIGPGHTVTALYEIVPAGSEDAAAALPLRYQAERAPSPAAADGELFTVNVRYQPPMGGTSTLISVPMKDVVTTLEGTSDDFRFAAGVASFGMVLRASPHRGNATLASTAALVKSSAGDDARRRELQELVGRASLTKGAGSID